MQGLHAGNSFTDKELHSGWLAGHFMPETDPRHSRDIEVRYNSLVAGTAKKEMSEPIHATTFWLVTAGKLRNEYLFSDGSGTTITCSTDQYVLIMPGARHNWEVEERCQVLCVRWPSAPDLRMPLIQSSESFYGTWRVEKNHVRRDPWLLAHFMRPGDLRRVKEVEVDYGLFSRGDSRRHWISRKLTALMILVRGNVAMQFIMNEAIEKIALTRPGDYVLSRPAQLQQNNWQIKQDTIVLTILWPSLSRQEYLPQKK